MLVFIKQKLHNLISDQKFSEIFTGGLQEPLVAYNADFEGKNKALRPKNRLLWDLFSDI
jgi:hypothetical protein